MNSKLPNPRNLAHGGTVSQPTRNTFREDISFNWRGALLIAACLALAFAAGWHLRGAM